MAASALPESASKAVDADEPNGDTRVALGSRFDLGFCGLSAAVESGLVLMRFAGRIGTPAMLVGHLAIVGIVAAMLILRIMRGEDTRLIAISFVATMIAGPLGAIAALVMGANLKIESRPSKLLEAWYQRISGHREPDRLGELYERIQSGRARSVAIERAREFSTILSTGKLEEKQAVLAVIAQKYHADFAPLLQQAMNSPDPPIRVQAAAVAAKLRATYKARFANVSLAAKAATVDANEATGLARRLLEVAQSRVLDGDELVAAHKLIKDLCARALEQDPAQIEALVLSAESFGLQGDVATAAEILKPLADVGKPEALARYRDYLARLGGEHKTTEENRHPAAA